MSTSIAPGTSRSFCLCSLQAELQEERATHKATRSKLSEASVDLSASTMLDLELADYQRTVDNLNQANERLKTVRYFAF
jgi:hypothetical protein